MKKFKDKESVSAPVDTVDTLLGAGSVLKGDLEFTGGLRIDGLVKGHISAKDSDQGVLILTDAGVIEGDVNVPHMIINGKVDGNIVSSSHIELQSNAVITGDIHYKALEMELGAVLNGSLVSSADAPVYDVISGGNTNETSDEQESA